MDCSDYELLLAPYLHGELTEDEKSLLEAHLRDCVSCRQALEEFHQVRVALLTWNSITPSAHIENILFSQVDEIAKSHRERAELAERVARGMTRWWALPVFTLLGLFVAAIVTSPSVHSRFMFNPSFSSFGIPETFVLLSIAGLLVALLALPFTFLRRRQPRRRA